MVPVAPTECAVYTGRRHRRRVWSPPRNTSVVRLCACVCTCVCVCVGREPASRRLTNRVGDSHNGGSPGPCSRRIRRRRRHLIRRLIFSGFLSRSLTHCPSVPVRVSLSVSAYGRLCLWCPSSRSRTVFLVPPTPARSSLTRRPKTGRGSTRVVLRTLRDVRTNYNNMIRILSIENYAGPRCEYSLGRFNTIFNHVTRA